MRISFEFNVFIYSKNNVENTSSHKKKVIRWYQNIAKEYNMIDLQVTHIKDNKFKGEYIIHPDDLADPLYNPILDVELFLETDNQESNMYIVGNLVSIKRE